jgi:hypothetical protein
MSKTTQHSAPLQCDYCQSTLTEKYHKHLALNPIKKRNPKYHKDENPNVAKYFYTRALYFCKPEEGITPCFTFYAVKNKMLKLVPVIGELKIRKEWWFDNEKANDWTIAGWREKDVDYVEYSKWDYTGIAYTLPDKLQQLDLHSGGLKEESSSDDEEPITNENKFRKAWADY